MVGGVAVFDALTLNISATLTVRFRLKFPAAQKEFFQERVYTVRPNGLSSIQVSS